MNRLFVLPVAALLGLVIATIPVQASSAPLGDPKEIISRMVSHEDEAALHRQHFFYVATERSDRTGNHTWKERVAETNAGKLRFLLEVDGQPIPPDRLAAERGRLAAIVADPAAFSAAEHAKKNDEDKAKAMLDLLPTAFIMENLRQQGDLILLDFHPNPAYQTQSMEEKVLHGMSGTVTIDSQAMRLHRIQAKLPQDISVGFGLASIHAGSSFESVRDMVAPGQWKTAMLDTAINGKAILFKALGKNEHVVRTDFKQLPYEMTVAQAVELVEQ